MGKHKFFAMLSVCLGMSLVALPAFADFTNDESDPALAASCDVQKFEADCAIGCPNGYATNGSGCPVCECFYSLADEEQGCPAAVRCDQKCEDYLRDEKGCASCACAPPLLDNDRAYAEGTACDLALFESACLIGCPDGYTADAEGCPVCACFKRMEEEAETAADGACPSLTCGHRCQDYQIGLNGCATCACASLMAGE
ncbi:MAG: hypothetical protein C4523_01160 [Myxococcales bacterium]|nr:MAG: hypothetical protein C4523_01160 [Myxococcales bacterium]